jgi:hypothetical protein
MTAYVRFECWVRNNCPDLPLPEQVQVYLACEPEQTLPLVAALIVLGREWDSTYEHLNE